ncbi:MAG: tetratricopeptide repeat protein [Dokdonella sp.]|nr:MAG: tetratricopeptide repeat protein [Dokdonella sp.]
MAHPRLESCLALYRADRLVEAEAGYRACLADGIDAHLPLSALLLQQGRHDEVVALLEPQFAMQGDNATLAINLSIALRKSGRNDEALRIARQATAQAPDHPAAWNAQGLAALESGDAEAALHAFEQGLRLAPGAIALDLHRSKALRHLARHAEAIQVLQRLLASAPDMLEAWRDLATAQTALGQYQVALKSAEHAMRLAPNDAEVSLQHAVALLHAGQTRAAIKRLEQLQADPQAWVWLAQARLRDNDIEGARAAYGHAAARDPDDPFIRHFVAALGGELPEQVEADYIRKLFDDFAARFESTLVDALAYSAPKVLPRFLAAHGADDASRILDLGCGTGLMGAALAAPGRTIDGVDLSERMLAHARAKGVYRELHAAELLQFLKGSRQRWDLVIAADVFVYVAHLAPVFAAIHACLEPGGWFAFSIECSDGPDTQLQPQTGRYRHSPEALVRELAAAGFDQVQRETLALRMEMGKPVAGELLLARRI